ncbi:SDR family oxidoreductase [Bacteriovoracaceae bacterium]|nr:SDR family oxidoreductase [Bacteriovoracaceae bacterium]
MVERKSFRTALVMGASDGIGKAIAHSLARENIKIIALSRSEEKLQTLINELPGNNHQIISTDLSQTSATLEKIQTFLKGNPGFDIIINNSAGPGAGPLTETSPEAFASAFTQHISTPHEIIKLNLEYMQNQQQGRIINIISTSVKTPLPSLGTSNTIRGATASWAKTLANELGPNGITVNSVLPGATGTGRLDSLLKKWSEQANQSIEETTKQKTAVIPLRRFGKPEEIANAVAFLASEKASYITGVALCVDGGRTPCL